MEYKDYYQILGVDKNAAEKDIKKAYRRLARQYHPDKNPNDQSAEDKFKEINEAYEVVGNPENRARYDQLGRSYQRYQQMGGAPSGFDYSQWSTGYGSGAGYQQVDIDLDDLLGDTSGFSSFFRTVFGGRRPPRSDYDGAFAQQAQAGSQNIEYQVEISLEEAYHGTTRTLSKNVGEQFTAKIPRGAKTGTKVRLRGKGEPGPGGPGDLFLVIQIKPHDTFQREGNDLRVIVPVDVVTAVLGDKVTVPTFTGPVKLTIPKATQGGRIFRLRGKGMPDLRKEGEYGDLLVSIQIRVPETLSDEEDRLYRELAELSGNQKT